MAAPVTYRSYLRRAAATFIAVCGLTAGFNLTVDPYGMFGTPRFAGVNEVKPAAPDRIRFAKPYLADRIQARTVIGGNSRPEMGIDPASPCWLPEQRPVFNAAVPGASLAQQIQFIEHTAATGDVNLVLLGLDFMDFFVDPSKFPDYGSWPGSADQNGPNLRVDLQAHPVSSYEWQRIRDWLSALFSLETLGDAVNTVFAQGSIGSADRREDGFNPADDYWPIIRHEGQHVLFAQKSNELMRYLSRPGVGIHQGARRWSWTFETLDRFLDRAHQRGIEVILFINPYHADYLAAIELSGRWTWLEDWKRTLARLAETRSVTLWDFNAVNPQTSEQPPQQGERQTSLTWFWEPAHYRREYGEALLSVLLDHECHDVNAPSPGAVLSTGALEDHLAELRADLEGYMSSEPAAVRRLLRARGNSG